MAVLFILDSLLTLFVKKGASHTTSSLVPAQKDWHVTVIPVAKTTFLHSYVILYSQWQGRRRNGLIYNDLYTPIDLFHPVISCPILFCKHASNGRTFSAGDAPMFPRYSRQFEPRFHGASFDWWGDLNGYGCSDPSRPMQQWCHCDAPELWVERSKIKCWEIHGIILG